MLNPIKQKQIIENNIYFTKCLAIPLALAAIALLGTAIYFHLGKHKSLVSREVALLGGFGLASFGFSGGFLINLRRRIKDLKDLDAQNGVPDALLKRTDHTQRISRYVEHHLFEFLGAKGMIVWMGTQKSRRGEFNVQKLATALGRRDNDEMTPAQYITAFGKEAAIYKHYFPNGDILGFAVRAKTTAIVELNVVIGEMIAKYFQLWAKRNAETVVPSFRAIQRQGLLCTAASKGYVEFMKLMLAHNAPVDLPGPNAEGDNALILASYQGQLTCVRVLVEEYGASVDCADSQNVTALHWAVNSEFIEVARYLIYRKADVSIESSKGNKAIHSAKTPEMINLLVGHNADLVAPNKNGHSAIYAYGADRRKVLHDHALALLRAKQS